MPNGLNSLASLKSNMIIAEKLLERPVLIEDTPVTES
jgi:hypothetical protein